MSVTTNVTPSEQGLLLELFKNHVREELRAQAIAAVSQEIDKAVNKAVDNLNSEVQSHYDLCRDEMVHRIVVSRRGEPHV